MSPADARILQLVAELRRDWEQAERHCQRAQTADPAADEARAAFVALSLDHAYQAFETFLVRLERALGLPERHGVSWHVALLADAMTPVPGLRPAVYPTTVQLEWNELLRFRHFLRHAYAVELDPQRLAQNRDRLVRAIEGTRAHVLALLDALAST